MTLKAFFFRSLISNSALVVIIFFCIWASYLGYKAANWTLIRYDQWRIAETGANQDPIKRTESFYDLLRLIDPKREIFNYDVKDGRRPATAQQKELEKAKAIPVDLANKNGNWTAENDDTLLREMGLFLLAVRDSPLKENRIEDYRKLVDVALKMRGDLKGEDERTEQLKALSILLGIKPEESSTSSIIVDQATLYQGLFEQAQEDLEQPRDGILNLDNPEGPKTSNVFSVAAYKKRVVSELCLQLNGRAVGDSGLAKKWRNDWEKKCAPRVRYLLLPSYGTGELLPSFDTFSLSYVLEFVVRLFLGVLITLIFVGTPLLLGLFGVAVLIRLRQLAAPLTRWTERETLKVALSGQVE